MPPKRPFGLVHRDRLLRALGRAVERHRVALVTAPAGYGKTSLLADFLADTSAPSCWYSVDPEDDNARSFLHYLVIAIRQQFPNFGEGILHTLSTSADLRPALPNLMGSLVSEIQQQVDDWFVLVIEDLHWFEDSDVLLALDLLLRHLPENCFVILTSRTRLSLSALTRLSAQRAITKLTSHDLAFKEDEILALLTAAGHGPDAETARRLAEESEGWIAGIILLAPWLDQPAFLSSLGSDAGHEELFWYLSEQVLQRLPEHWQDLLARCSILQDIPVELCEQAFGIEDAGDILKQMAESGMFVSELRDGTTFRYHALFRQFLIERAERERQPVAAWHCGAAAFYAARGRCAEAVAHYLGGGDRDSAALVLEARAPDLYHHGEWALLSNLVTTLQREAAGVGPELSLWQSRCLIQLGEPDAALALAEAYSHVLDREGSPMAVALCELTRAGALRSKGHVESAIEAARKALAQVERCPETTQTRLLQAEAYHYIGASLGTAGLYRAALPELQKALVLFEILGATYHLSKVHSGLGIGLYRLGRYPEAIAHYEQAIEASKRLGHSATLASVLNNLGNLYVAVGSFGLAQDVLRSALEAARVSGNTRAEAYVTQSLGRALAATGEFEEAARMLREAVDLTRQSGETVSEARAILDLARALAQLGSTDQAESLLSEASTLIEANPATYDLALLGFSRGLVWFLLGDSLRAKDGLVDALQRFAQSGDARWTERTSLLLAQVAYQLEDLPAATTFLLTLRGTLRSDDGPAALRPESILAQGVLRFAVDELPDAVLFARLLSVANAAGSATAAATSPVQARAAERPIVKALSLGDFSVELNGTALDESKGLTSKAKELLVYLLASGRRARREELIEALWPDNEASKDSSVLRTNVYRLRKVLYDQCIVVQGDTYRLDPAGHFWFDLHYFKELVQRSRQSQCSPVERTMLLETAVELYRGPFLNDVSSEWCLAERFDSEVKFTGAALALANSYLESDNAAAALSLCDRILAGDPSNEDAILLQVRTHLAMGDRSSAMLHWRGFERRLEAEGSRPSTDAAARFQRLLRAS
jgi:ATP/maltotriose-dependent transcriptional regulator MalT/DNA-binding SARP family transcriptional activator